MSADAAYTLIYDTDPNKSSIQEFKTLLEKPKDDVKIVTMKRILLTMLNGNPMPDLLMHVIRYIMPSRNKTLKKLLYVYWEIVPKLDAEGKLKHEMILVCNAIRNDLQHPNEYIRGNTLKFLTKLKESELLEPLIPTVIACLEHRHSYVRKNCIFAIDSIYRLNPDLIPDAPEMLTNLLAIETDPICIRNCFTVLGSLNRDAALSLIQENLENLTNLDSLLQLSFIEFIRKDLKFANGALKQQYLNLIVELLSSKSSSVVYESALTLTLLANNDEVILQAGKKFIDLAIKESDNNVKLICLSRIIELSKKNPGIFQDSVLDLLRILTCTDLDVKKQTLNLVLEFIDSKNVDNVIKFFKKELMKVLSTDEEATNDKSNDYKQLLIQTINKISINFIDNSIEIVDLLLESLSQLNSQSAYDIIAFVKQIIEKFPTKRESILVKLIDALNNNIKSGKVLRGALWIIGEYALTEKNIQDSWKFIRSNVGELPILASEKKKRFGNAEEEQETNEEEQEGEDSKEKKKHSGPVILPDGTYATENALTTKEQKVDSDDEEDSHQPPIRKLILGGDFYLASILSSALLKLILRFQDISKSHKILNVLKAEATLIMVSILRVGEASEYVKETIDEDSAERILSYVRFLMEDYEDAEDSKKIVKEGFLTDTKKAFEEQIKEASKAVSVTTSLSSSSDSTNATGLDEVINFRLFPKSNAVLNTGGFNDDDELENINKNATSSTLSSSKKEKLASRLNKIIPLTGFSDPVYAEGYIKVHQFDVVLDVLVVNQTANTLRNLSVEFATLGDLKVVDKPVSANITPHGFHKVSTTIKVTSADTGVIFGNILYDGAHATDQTIVILNDVHIDIMDYIKPATCEESQFRKMWNEFEWENKIVIKSSTIGSLSDYLSLLLKNTNMMCLTPGAVIGDANCQFLSANLYSKSSFGEDALANLCIEKLQDGPILGHVRIRSKGQGLALSLGDRIASIARKTQKANLKIV
ncbi:coatomer subunit beta [Saccharomycopsis crataegensis]|uniref:Coatomer subunit beta n=1 Tax=Saccharomycopsis crataegensis TaxID=43959 RepID=A0AAV5QPU6_9ASCO|nr:coatomer subunit beta [Saccharomycopsis crataegensis]